MDIFPPTFETLLDAIPPKDRWRETCKLGIVLGIFKQHKLVSELKLEELLEFRKHTSIEPILDLLPPNFTKALDVDQFFSPKEAQQFLDHTFLLADKTVVLGRLMLTSEDLYCQPAVIALLRHILKKYHKGGRVDIQDEPRGEINRNSTIRPFMIGCRVVIRPRKSKEILHGTVQGQFKHYAVVAVDEFGCEFYCNARELTFEKKD